MKSSLLFSVLLAATVSSASLVPPTNNLLSRADLSESNTLNYLLAITNAKSSFYNTALQRFSASDFSKAGFPATVRGRYQQMADHAASHTAKLGKAVGTGAVQACAYVFPINNTMQFVALSDDIETATTSAILGAFKSITNPDNALLVASIMATSARHAAWSSAVVDQYTPWSAAYETAVTMNQGWSYFATFTGKCPPTNVNLGLKVFAPLSASLFDKPTQSKFKADPNVQNDGSTVMKLSWGTTATNARRDVSSAAQPSPSPSPSTSAGSMPKPTSTSPLYIAIFSSLSTTQYVQIRPDNTVSLPAGLAGTIYVVVTSSPNAVSDDNTIAGPALVQFPLASTQRQK